MKCMETLSRTLRMRIVHNFANEFERTTIEDIED